MYSTQHCSHPPRIGLVRPALVSDGAIGEVSPEEKGRDQERLIQGWLTSQKQRNFSLATIASAQRGVANFLAAAGKFCWEITVNDVRDYHDTLCELGLEVTTRRGYLTHIKQFFAFIQAHPDIPLTTLEVQAGKTAERVDHKYGVRLQQPVDRWYMPVHVTDEVACKRTTRALPTKGELRAFFAFLRGRINESHKGIPVARDYAMFRFLYHTGMRENEVAMVDVKDVRFDLGTIHCRIGKGSGGSGPRERWIPMLYGLDRVLRIYLAEVRPKFVGADRTKALFLAEAGGPIMNRTIRHRLRQNLQAAQKAGIASLSGRPPTGSRAAILGEGSPGYPGLLPVGKERASRICRSHFGLEDRRARHAHGRHPDRSTESTGGPLACPGGRPPGGCCWSTGVDTALSPADLVALRVTDFDTVARRLSLPSHPFSIRLSPPVHEVLCRYLEHLQHTSHGSDSPYFFVNRLSIRQGTPVGQNYLTVYLHKRCLGEIDCTLQQLRISYLVDVAATGRIKVLEYLGLTDSGSRHYLASTMGGLISRQLGSPAHPLRE